MIWASGSKGSAGAPSELDDATVRGIGLGGGRVDVKVCALTDVSSALRFMRRVADRGRG